MDELNLDEFDEAVRSKVEAYATAFAEKQAEGLKSKTSELMTEAKEAKRKARDLELAMQRAQEDGAKKAGDFEAVEKAVTDRIRQEYEPVAHERDLYKGLLVGSKKGQAVSSLGLKLTDPDIADELFGSKIVAEIDGESVSLKYLGVDDSPVASNEADYLKYLAKIPKYAKYLVGTTSTGGGATGSTGRGGAATKMVSRQQFDGMSQADRQAHVKAGGQVSDQ